MLKKVIKKVDLIQAISKTIYKDLIKLNINQKKIVIIPNSINLSKFKLKKRRNKRLNLITVARFAEKKKGYDFIIKISSLLVNKVNFKWTLVGRGVSNIKNYNFVSKNLKYFKLVEEIGHNNENYFPNSRLINLYKNSDLYLHLSRIESFGVSIIEAMASGLPVLSFKSKGSSELIKNKINGFQIDNFNIKKFAKKIIFISKYEKLFAKRKKIRSSVKTYDLKSNTNKLIGCYRKLNTF